MAEPKRPTSDLYSVKDDGTKTDVWIFEELLGEDPVDPEYRHVIDDDEKPQLTENE